MFQKLYDVPCTVYMCLASSYCTCVQHLQEILDDDEIGKEGPSFLVRMEDLKNHKVELLDGDKKNSKWLLLDDHCICHLKDSETYFWESKQQRSQKSPYKLSTITVRGPHEVEFMYTPDCHTCYQDSLDSLKQKFRSSIKYQ